VTAPAEVSDDFSRGTGAVTEVKEGDDVMAELPRLRGDQTLTMLRDPYEFIRRHAAELGSDGFRTTLFLRPAVCLTGPEAVTWFYSDDLQRSGAAPLPVQATLFGRGGVQTLDGETHQQRKRLFLRVYDTEEALRLARVMSGLTPAYVRSWLDRDQISVFEAFQPLLMEAACRWLGFEPTREELERRTPQVASLFHDAGIPGPRHVRALASRREADRWAATLVSQVRRGRRPVVAGSPITQLVTHRDADGSLLSARTAGIELLNVIRPVVAVSVFVALAAHALHQHPEWVERLHHGTPTDVGRFVEEVRRFYPFFPAAVARTRHDTTWGDHAVPGGTRVLLDLYGTDHDERAWERPDVFDPDRFAQPVCPHAFVPQGGGSVPHGHRCPGEPATGALMAAAIELLVGVLRYDVVEPADLVMDRAPALPRGGFLIRNLRIAE